MKAEDAARAAMLVKASKCIANLIRAMERTQPEPTSGDWRGMQISVGDFCEAGGSLDATIEVDLLTAHKLIPHIQGIIGDELLALGVSP